MMAHASWLMAHGSWLKVSWLLAHGQGGPARPRNPGARRDWAGLGAAPVAPGQGQPPFGHEPRVMSLEP